MFKFDTKVKQEALNYATLMNVLDMTDHRLEPQFDKLSELIPVDAPMDNPEICKVYVDFFHIGESILLHAYKIAYRAFSELKETDEIIKRGSSEYPPLLAETNNLH